MKTRSKDFVLESEVPWEVAGEGMRRQILGYDGQLMLVKVAFEKGAIGVGHAHFHSQSTYVVSGVFEFHVDGKKQIVKAGDGVYIAPDVFHGATCLEAGTLIDVFSPVREDFLKR
ncbi:MAG: cupin domain-containing protein [Prevotellaceae bacterium]|jgi:quercetin dioxygenase-like cupin family protein|nr:cupin domain-containing protein [Prevotellaceae bacterium]